MTGTIINNYNISDSNKAKIPYIGTDTLIFVSNTGDTATLIGQGKDDYYEKDTKLAKGGDCPLYEVNNYEYIEVNYVGNELIKSLKYLVFKNDFDPKNLTGLSIKINNQINVVIGNTIGISFEYVTDYLPVQDSILIGNMISKGGYIDNNYKILYNKQYGILKFKDTNNKTWVLNYKPWKTVTQLICLALVKASARSIYKIKQ